MRENILIRTTEAKLTIYRAFHIWILKRRNTKMGQLLSSSVKTISRTLFYAEPLPYSLRFSKLSEQAIPPTRGSKGAAGYDLYAAHDAVVPAQGKALVKTDIAIALPDGWYGRVAPRFVNCLN